MLNWSACAALIQMDVEFSMEMLLGWWQKISPGVGVFAVKMS